MSKFKSNKMLQIAYFGAPSFSAYFLEKLLNDKDLPVEVKLVITQPDKKAGRKQILTPSPVKQLATKYNLQVLTSLPITVSRLSIDLALLFAYGEIIPQSLLEIPKYGFWNIHPSLLPKYRGAAPSVFPLLLGDKETGVTIMQMDQELDHGPIIDQEKIFIDPTITNDKLLLSLLDKSYELLKKNIFTLGEHKYKLHPQDHSKATYTFEFKKNDGYLSLDIIQKALHNQPLTNENIPGIIKKYYEKNLIKNLKLEIKNSSKQIYDLFRSLYPWPGIWTKIIVGGKEKRLKIIDMKYVDDKILLKKVQLEGKTPVDFTVFQRAHHIF